MSAAELASALGLTRDAVIKAWGKSYIRRTEEPDDELYIAGFHAIGIDDDVAIGFLLTGWRILREQREQPPGETAGTNGGGGEKMMSEAQRALIGTLASERNLTAPDLAGMTWAKASELITEIKSGNYDASKWEVPF